MLRRGDAFHQSMMARSALGRLSLIGVVLVVLWVSIAWAVWLP